MAKVQAYVSDEIVYKINKDVYKRQIHPATFSEC